jgi:hypothetical protein
LLPYQRIELQPQVLEETHELGSALFHPKQRVKAHCIRRHEFVQLDARLGGLCTCGEELWDLRLTEMSGQVHHQTSTLSTDLYSAPHNRMSEQALYRVAFHSIHEE